MLLPSSSRALPLLRNLRQQSSLPTLPALRRALATETSSPAPKLNSTSTAASQLPLPLAGVRVLEIGHLIAAPYAGFLLAYYGADVIKVEAPGKGDPLRVWREVDPRDNTSPWFRSLARNKKSVTIDLRAESGRELVRQLAAQSDVLLENFKPGTLEKWKMGPAELHKLNPSLIFTRVSGYGQTGPMRGVGGYASVCEAFGGFRYINGHPDAEGKPAGAPVRPNISLGDTLAGLNAAFGTVMALLSRNKLRAQQHPDSAAVPGQTVDVAIYEAVMGMLEGIIPAYDQFGVVRGPSGSSVTGIVPTNAYVTRDPAVYIIIGANGDQIYVRLMQLLGREDLIGPEYKTNPGRLRNQAQIEEAITAWTSQRSAEEALRLLREADVPAGRINSVEDLLNEPQVHARGMVETITVPGPRTGGGAEGQRGDSWELKVPGSSPVLDVKRTEHRAGPDLGADNDEIFSGLLGLSHEQQDKLRKENVI